VRAAIPGIISFVAQTPGRMIAAMGSLAALLIRLAGTSFARFLSAVQTGASAVVGFARRFPGMIGGALASLPGLLFTVGVGAMNRLREAFANGIGRLIDIVRTLPGRMATALGDLGSILYNAGRELIGGLVDGIRDAAGSVTDAIRDVVPGSSAIGSILGGKSGPGRSLPSFPAGTVGIPDFALPAAAQGDIILELDGYEIGRARSVYQGVAARARMDRGGR
jgi:hypothetical protein